MSRRSLNGVWGSSPRDVFAVGYPATILHYDGFEWSSMTSGTNEQLLGAVGVYGAVLRGAY